MESSEKHTGVEAVGRNFLWMAWSAAISVANSLVVWIVFARMRDVDEVGRFTVVMGLYALFMTVCTLGLPGYLVAEISRRSTGSDPGRGTVEAFIANASLVMLGSGCVAAASMCLFGLWASPSSEAVLATLVLSLAIVPSGLIAVGEASMVALGRTRIIGLISTAENLLRTVVPIFLIWSGFGLIVIVLSLALTRFAALAAYVALARRDLDRLPFDLGGVKAILHSTPTFAGTVILSSIVWQGGSVLLGRYSSEAETAKFGVASRFLIPAAILLASYADVIQPLLAKAADQGKRISAVYLARFVRGPLGLAVAAAVASPFLSLTVLSILFGERYAGSAAALNIFALCLIPISMIMIVARGLYAQGQQRYDLIANAFGVVVFVTTALILIPQFGAVGAATAQLSGFITMAILELNFIKKVLAGFSLLEGIRVTNISRVAADAEYQPAEKPRILMIGMHLTKTRGGISTLTAAIRDSSLADEFEIDYVASQAEEFGVIRKFLLAVTSTCRVVWHCVTRRPDLVYIHVGSNASLYREGFLVLLAKLHLRTVVTHFHAGDVELYYSRQSRLGRWFIRTAIGTSNSVIAVSTSTANSIRDISRSDEIVVIPNAIDTAAFRPRESRDIGPVRLLFVGAVGKLKGERDLLRALAKLRSSRLDLKVSIVGFGAGSLYDECRHLGISDMIEFLGPVAVDQMRERYAAADIFVLPTYAEGMPMSVLEAMASGLAIVTTQVGGIPELIDNGENGFMVEPGDIDGLASQIQELAEDPQLRRRLGQAARRKAVNDFDSEHYRSALRSHLAEQLRKRGSRALVPKLVAKRAAKTAATWVRRTKRRGGVNIIAYHRVVGDLPRAEQDGYYGLSVSTDSFRKHCEILKANFDVMSLETAAQELAEGSVDRPIAVITFDDGYRDFYEQAFPILSDLKLPATMFLPTNFVGSNVPLAHDQIFWLLRHAAERGTSLVGPLLEAGVEYSTAKGFARPAASLALTERLVYLPFRLREDAIRSMRSALDLGVHHPPDYRLLDWQMVREMAAEGITFGAHTVNHVVLPLEDTPTIINEIEQSRLRLERELSTPIRTFAYPNGEHSDSVRSAVASAGFTVAVTTRSAVNGAGADLLALDRTCLSEESTRGLTGHYSQRVARMRLGA